MEEEGVRCVSTVAEHGAARPPLQSPESGTVLVSDDVPRCTLESSARAFAGWTACCRGRAVLTEGSPQSLARSQPRGDPAAAKEFSSCWAEGPRSARHRECTGEEEKREEEVIFCPCSGPSSRQSRCRGVRCQRLTWSTAMSVAR